MSKQSENSEISLKNTKEQILAAYNQMMSRLAEKKAETPQEQRKKDEALSLVNKVSNYTSDDIISHLSVLKVKAGKQLDALSEQLIAESTKLAEIRQAIAIEQKHLKELYQINETANSLSVLIQAQEERRAQFNTEMQDKKLLFEQEMATKKQQLQQQLSQLETSYSEQKEKLEKSRKREEEEYAYKLESQRRSEVDKYNQERAKYQKELKELGEELAKQQAEIATREGEYKTLKLQVEEFPRKLQQAVSKAQEDLQVALSKEYAFTTQIKEVEYNGKLALSEQKVKSLELKLKEQEALIKEFSQKSDIAMQQVQTIACRALDSSSMVQRVASSLQQVDNKDKS